MSFSNKLTLITIGLCMVSTIFFDEPLVLYFIISLASLIFLINYIFQKKIIEDYHHYQSYSNITKYKLSWIITEPNKKTFTKIKKRQSGFLLSRVFTFLNCFLFIFSPIAINHSLNILNFIIGYLLIIVLITLCILTYIYFIENYPLFLIFSILLISLIVIMLIHDYSLEIFKNSMLTILIFIGSNITLFLISVFFILKPHSIRKISQNLFLYNGLPNILMLGSIFFIQNILSDLKFLDNSTIKQLPQDTPNWLVTFLKNNEFKNQINDIISTLMIDHYIGILTFYGLITIIIIYLADVILNFKKNKNNQKAKKEFRNLIDKMHKDNSLSYSDIVDISYYGGDEYDEKLLSLKEVHNFIMEKENEIYNSIPLYRKK